MIHAYGEEYLGHARKVMANMLDCAVNQHGLALEKFYDLFLVSSVAKRFQRGDCAVIAGRSGAELVEMVLEETGVKAEDEEPEMRMKDMKAGLRMIDKKAGFQTEGRESGPQIDQRKKQKPEQPNSRSREYWTGWALAYYQWESALPFDRIARLVPIESIHDMYSRYHEMDIRQFCDAMQERIAAGKQEARLKYYRRRLGLSQRQLAEAAEIPVRTIQQYEQRQKNINKAQAEYLLRLARVLQCSEADLMEQPELL